MHFEASDRFFRKRISSENFPWVRLGLEIFKGWLWYWCSPAFWYK